MESKIDQNDDYFFGNLEIIISDSKFKISTFIFRKLHSRFLILEKKKKLSGQIVVCFPVSTYINLNVKYECLFEKERSNLFSKINSR